MADPSSFQLGDTGADENLHRSDPKGEVSMMELDELSLLISDENSSSKKFYIAGSVFSLSAASLFSIVDKASSLSGTDLWNEVSGKYVYYLFVCVVFLISSTAIICLMAQSNKEKNRALRKIKNIQEAHGYKPKGSNEKK